VKRINHLAGIVNIAIGESCTPGDNVGSANSVLVILAAGESDTALQIHVIVFQSGWAIQARSLGQIAIERLLVLGKNEAEIVVSDHVATGVGFNDPASTAIAGLTAIDIVAGKLDLGAVVDEHHFVGDAFAKRAMADGDVGAVLQKKGLSGLLKSAVLYGAEGSAQNPDVLVITACKAERVECDVIAILHSDGVPRVRPMDGEAGDG